MNIKDVAKLAKVSKSTVSRVLNNPERVNAEMRRRVLEVVRETGYRPNSLAKELVIKETRLIGVIVPRINTNVFADIVEGITLRLSENGYNVILLCSKADETIEISHFEFLQKKQVDGIIFFPGNMTLALRELINTLSTPLIILGLDDPLIKRSVVSYDEYKSSKAIVEHFISQGHRQIAFIGIDKDRSPVGQERKLGYTDALKAHAIPLTANYIYEGSFELQSGFDGAKHIFSKSEIQPTAIFAATDYLAIGTINYLKSQGLSVPEDVSVAGFDDLEISVFFNPSITSIKFDYFHSGEVAAQFVIENIQEPSIIRKYMLGFQIINRDSTSKR